MHDYITAAISHVPHVVASSLVGVVAKADEENGLLAMLAAGGFRDITRIASSSPAMWKDICLTNRDSIGEFLDKYIIELKEIKNNDLRSLIDYIPQVPTIINGSLRENIFFNRPYSKDEEKYLMEDVLFKSILKSKTFDDIIDNAGANLSGGEKQKISIARSLYSKAEVLILDEITSNIDAESADQILQRLLKDKEKRITFIITHDRLPNGVANKEIILQN